MTKAGTINTQPVSMLRERIRSVGISLLGGNSGVEGPYELGIDEIRAVNEEDVTAMPRQLTIFHIKSKAVLTAPGRNSRKFNAGANIIYLRLVILYRTSTNVPPQSIPISPSPILPHGDGH